MHHSEISEAHPMTSQTIKAELLPAIQELPLSYRDYDVIIKDEFNSDDDSFMNMDLSIGADFIEAYESPRKNKRKNPVPQRAVQSENSQTSSLENGTEFDDEGDINDFSKIDFKMEEDIDVADDEDLLQEIDEDTIFKGLEEETEVKSLDKNMLENVKEEWRSHWGIKCNMCEKIFPYRSEFDLHYRNNYETAPIYTCSFCNKSLEKYSTFRSHCYRHITEGRYKCKECPKGFSLQSLLHVHMLAKHTRAKPYMCEECGKSFVTKPGLKIHLGKHKKEVKEEYPCVECGKVLHTKGGLTSHLNVHRLGRRFMCDFCGKTFTQKVNMQQHVKQHTGDKPHECDKCGKCFAEKSQLSRHYSFHSEQRPFKCDVCQKMYKTERCLKVHSMVHTKNRPYICSYCSKGFLSSTKLKQHYNIHTGERPYACKYCERKFTNYPNWLKHTRRRHNVDHKTGEHLPPKEPKPPKQQTVQDETSPPPTKPEPVDITDVIEIPTPLSELPQIEDPILQDHLITDFALSKTDELLLQQGLLNFPISDDKFLLNQVDLFSSGNNGLVVPLFPAQLQPNTMIQTGQSTSQLFDSTVPLQFIQ